MVQKIAQLYFVRMPSAHVRLSTGMAAAVNCFGIPYQLWVVRDMPSIPRWPLYLSMFFGAALLLLILIERGEKLTRALPVLFTLNAAVVSFALAMVYAHAGDPTHGFVYFQASELGVLLAGMLAPGLVSGAVAMLMHSGSSLIQFYGFPESLQKSLAPDLPGALFVYSLAGFLVLILRIRVQQLEFRSAKAHAEVASARRVGEAFLSVRDKMNSPVQSIELATALLEKKNGDPTAVLKQLKESCDRLRELNELLKQYESSVDWTSVRGGIDIASRK